MKSVRVYLAGIPPKNNKKEKIDVLKFFYAGVDRNDAVCNLISDMD